MVAGLYVHVPFCSSICPYCDFAVTTGGSERRASFVAALLREVESIDPGEWSFDTVYLGGGTPSVLGQEELESVLQKLRSRFELAPETRIFLEANPEDVDMEACRGWRELGVSTLSLGVQSFDDATLRFLGRRHAASEARRAVETALDADFECVSVDLMYGFPATAAECETTVSESVAQAVELGPQHLSCYQLTIHEGTAYGLARKRGELREVPNDEQLVSFLRIHRQLDEAGYQAYEISSFAREPIFRSAHNTKYWSNVPYLGLGPSAHSFSGRERWWNERNLAVWQKRIESGESPIASRELLSTADQALEALMLGLRTAVGIDLSLYSDRFGIDLVESNRDLVARLVDSGRLVCETEFLRPTLEGMAVADGMAAAFEIEGVYPIGKLV